MAILFLFITLGYILSISFWAKPLIDNKTVSLKGLLKNGSLELKQKNITFRMKNTKKKLISQSKIVKSSFTGSNITMYSGFSTVMKYMNRQNIVKIFGKSFPTVWYNATKFGVNQILMVITLSSIRGINRICKIAAFSGDGLVNALLKLDKAINENAISATLKNMGQRSARKLQMLLLSKNARWLHESGLDSTTLDADSIVKSVCGNQEWASNRIENGMETIFIKTLGKNLTGSSKRHKNIERRKI